MLPRSVNFTALSTRFSSALRSRTSSPLTRPGRPLGDIDVDVERLALRAGRERVRHRMRKLARRERLVPQHEPRGIRLGRVDHEGGQPRQMVGGAPDRLGPAALALGQIGGLQQLRQRQDAGQRRADVMGETGERKFDRARLSRSRARVCAPSASKPCACAFAMNPAPARSMPRRHGRHYTATFTSLRISAGVMPCARNSRRPVACVDLDSFLPSASRISR